MLRHAALPVVTLGGWIIGGLLGGAVITEKVFGRPGLGTVTLNAVLSQDAPVVLGTIVVGVVLLLAAYLLAWRKVRGAWLPFMTMLPLLVAVHFLGAAGFDFAAARGLGGIVEPELSAALAQRPGHYNIHTFLSLWGAIGALTVGMIGGFWLESVSYTHLTLPTKA